MTGKPAGARRPLAALLPTVVALGALALVWASTAGPARFFSASGRRVQRSYPTPTASPPASAATGDPLADYRDAPSSTDLSWIGHLIPWSLALLLAGLLAFTVALLWRSYRRRTARPAPVTFDVLPEPEAVSASVEEDAAGQLRALAEGSPRNGIVRAWLRVEQAVADVGVRRLRSETSTELTVRVLHELDIDPRPIGTLAALFREARFSEHELGEDARAAARSALQRIHDELRQAPIRSDRR
jgi:hypothetical protein